MNKIQICEKLKKSIRKIILFNNNQIISSGTGIAITETGILLTANHVVKQYATLSNPKIIASAASGAGDILRHEYKPFLYNVSFNINMPEFAKPLGIDLAILQPIEKITEKVTFIELEDDIPLEGTTIIMAGFPDEIKPPLHFDKILNFENPELDEKRTEIEDFFKHLMCLVMMKSGMIGAIHKIKLSGNSIISGIQKNINVEGADYWIDNASTYGASGGPVVNSSCKLIGILCEKGMTTEPYIDLEIPSGSTMALSHKLITWFLEK